MNNTQIKRPHHREASLREAGFDDLMKDVSQLGPAPNPSREMFVSVVFLALVGVALGIMQPDTVATAGIAAAAGAYVAIRWLLGIRKWGAR